MSLRWYPYHTVSLLIVLIVIFIFFYVLDYRNRLGTIYFLGSLILVLIWTVAQALEYAALSLSDKIVFANIQYIPIGFLPVLFFYLAVNYTNNYKLIKNKYLPYLMLIAPIALNMLLWTNELHGLMRQNVYLDTTGAMLTVGRTLGKAMIPFAIYNFTVLLITLYLLARKWLDKTYSFRTQTGFLFFSLLLPAIANFAHFAGFSLYDLQVLPPGFRASIYNVDLTPFTFSAAGVLLTIGIYRHGLFDIVPIAQNIIVEGLHTGLIVLDNNLNVLHYNTAALTLLGQPEIPLNKNTFNIKEHTVSNTACYNDFALFISQREAKNAEFATKNGYIELKQSDIYNKHGFSLGKVIQIDDITGRKSAEKESEQNEMAFLRAQIKPHFMYNALNVIAALCMLDPGAARKLILDLSSYMHHSFNFSNYSNVVSLEEELEFVKAYVRIEQARFKDKLIVNYFIECERKLWLPPLILQPLVENAIRHGIRKADKTGTVSLRVKSLDSSVLIEVEDNGVGMSEEMVNKILTEPESLGVGLSNVQKRLKKMYNTSLNIESIPGSGTKISMLLPEHKTQICLEGQT